MRQSLWLLAVTVIVLVASIASITNCAQYETEYWKDQLDWSVHMRLYPLQWNDSYIDSHLLKIGELNPKFPITFIQQYLVAFTWKKVSDEFRIVSQIDLLNYMRNTTGKSLKIGIDKQYGLLFRDFLDYHQIIINEDLEKTLHVDVSYSLIPFLFYKRNCRPRHVAEDFDIIITSSGSFFDNIRYYRESTGIRKEISDHQQDGKWNETTLINPNDFLPIKLAPALVGYGYDIYPYFLLGNSTIYNSRNSYFVSDIISLNRFYNFGKVTVEDVNFLNSLLIYGPSNSPNFTVDYESFDKMMENTETFLNMSLSNNVSLEQVYSQYFSSAFHYCLVLHSF